MSSEEYENLIEQYSNVVDELHENLNDKKWDIKELQQYIDQLKQELAEKDKEIELLKHLGKHETTTEMFKENTKLIIEKTQFAIQELEKVKDWCKFSTNVSVDLYAEIRSLIDQQIKELKVGKDVEKKRKVKWRR